MTLEEGPFRGHQLVEPDREVLIEKIQYVLQHPEESMKIGEQARNDMVLKYSEESFGKLLEREIWRIEDLLDEQKRRKKMEDVDL